MRSANFTTTGPSVSALHLHLIDTGRFSLQFYTRGSNVAQKGTGCPPPRVRAGAADWPVLKRGKALISGKSRAGCQAIAPVQMNAQKQISVESSKMSLVGSRLLDLRGGARGVVVGMNGQEAQQAADGHAPTGVLAGDRGGAAGPDDGLS